MAGAVCQLPAETESLRAGWGAGRLLAEREGFPSAGWPTCLRVDGDCSCLGPAQVDYPGLGTPPPKATLGPTC